MKVQFLLTNTLLVEHFVPVVEALERRGVDAVVVGLPRLRKSDRRGVFLACAAKLEKRGRKLERRLDPLADVTVTAGGAGRLRGCRYKRIKQRYGVSLQKNEHHFHQSQQRSDGFDGVLVHGPFDRGVFTEFFPPQRVEVIGYPRHDDVLDTPPSRDAARKELGIAPDEPRPVVAYLPTWGEPSTIPVFADALADLARDHLLVIKPHSLTEAWASEADDLARLRGLDARLLSSDFPLSLVAIGADLVLADGKSSTGAESLLVAPDTPVILTSTTGREEYRDDIDRLGPLVSEPHELRQNVSAQLRVDEYRAAREELRPWLWGDAPGRGGEQAADAILRLAALPQLSEPPDLFRFLRSWTLHALHSPRAALGALGAGGKS
jgi:hypothetical protein